MLKAKYILWSNDSSVEVGVVVFHFRGQSQLPEGPLPFLLFIIWVEGEGQAREHMWASAFHC